MTQRPGIKSFVLRAGRLTPGQQAALGRGLPLFGLASDEGPLQPQQIFGNRHPVTLEIGFGTGESLLAQASQHPQTNFIGVEVHKPGIGRLLMGVEAAGLHNVRVVCEDCVPLLQEALPEDSLDCVQIFFPDPWPKKRHHKRRLVNQDFLMLLKRPLKPGGLLHLATDWQPYAEQMEALLAQDASFQAVQPPPRPSTKFEARGTKLGHQVTDLAYHLKSS